MRATLGFHVLMGSIGLVTGFVALYASKGAPLHRRAGMVFVYSMVAMCGAGLLVAAVGGAAPALNIPVALLTAYLVVTALTAVRPPTAGARMLHIGGMVLALGVGVLHLAFGLQAVANGGTWAGIPAFPFFLFAVVGLLAGAGDLRLLRSGVPLRGAPRVARHLWRMSFALFIASLSFFIGQADVIPKPYRIRPLLALPVLMVLVTMLYWLWRVRVRRVLRGLVQSGVPEAA